MVAAKYEYRVIPAPRRGIRAKGLKAPEDRFAAAVAESMNEAARDGWEYLRSDTLPLDERQGLTGHATSWQVLLVFRRALDLAVMDPPTAQVAPPVASPVAPIVEPPAPQPAAAPAPPPLRATHEPPDVPLPPLRLERD